MCVYGFGVVCYLCGQLGVDKSVNIGVGCSPGPKIWPNGKGVDKPCDVPAEVRRGCVIAGGLCVTDVLIQQTGPSPQCPAATGLSRKHRLLTSTSAAACLAQCVFELQYQL